MTILSIDFETRATVDLPKQGLYRYAEHPDTDIWCMAYAFDDGAIGLWTPHDVIHSDDCALAMLGGTIGCDCAVDHGLPLAIVEHIRAGGEIRAWNAAFERVIWREIMVKRYGAPAVRDEQWHDTAAEAAAMSLPRGLGDCAAVLGGVAQKDKDGYAVMMKLTRPWDWTVEFDGDVPDENARRPIWRDEVGVYQMAELHGWKQARIEKELNEVRALHHKLHAYCMQDVETERGIFPKVRRLSPMEREVYLLTERMNDRGVPMDVALAVAAQRLVDEGVQRANAELAALTEGDVTAITNHRRLVSWLNEEQSVGTESVAKATVAELLEGELPPAARRALELRHDAGRASVAKIKKMLESVTEDSRLKGLLLYHGAGTGRWSGKGVQPQNFARGEVPDPEQWIDAVLAGDYDGIDLHYSPIVVVLSLLRAILKAPAGYDFIAGDYSAIEARVLNWLAGQHDVVDSFRQYDRAPKAEKPTHDPYRKQAVEMGYAERPEDVDAYGRQAGKAAELGCGFQMGWKKFIDAAWQVYQVRVDTEQSKAAVKAYRASHPKVKQLWYDANDAVLSAVFEPGSAHYFGEAGRQVKAITLGGYLYLVLPSKRILSYPAPAVVIRRIEWEDETTGETRTAMKHAVEVSGVDSTTRQWSRYALYGGIIIENVVQAIARDLLAEAQLRLDRRGYEMVLTVHDESIALVRKTFGSLEEFVAIMSEVPAWADGLPVLVEAWRGERYRK